MSDLSTLGITLGYGMSTTAGTKPTKFDRLFRVNNIGGITLDTEQIDSSAIEDYVTQYTAGRQDTGGEWSIVFNVNNDVIAALKKLFADSKTAKDTNQELWFEVVVPGLDDAFFVVAETGTQIPLPEMGQNDLLTLEISLVVSRYVGLDTKVALTEAAA